MSIIAEVWTFFFLDDSMASTYIQLFLDVMGICAVELITDAMVTEKGHGFAPAVNEPKDQMHSTGAIDPVTGVAKGTKQPGWTAAFLRRKAAMASSPVAVAGHA